MISKNLSGKTAFVTGGSRGIGSAVAIHLAREGAAVAITHSNSPDRAAEVVAKIESEGGRAISIKADSGSAVDIKDAVFKTVEAFGKIDILVNNAGVGLMGHTEQFSLDDFDKLVAVNIRGVYIAIQESIKHMGPGGRIINIGSCLGDHVGMEGVAAYSMTKAAVGGLTRGVARDLGNRGITVNNIQPGPIDTEMNPASGPASDFMKSFLALKHYGNVDEIAGAVAFLASPEASFITGACINVDGGFNA